jgi:signal peptidase I
MRPFSWLAEQCEPDPVVLSLLLAMLVARLALGHSVRRKLALQARMTVETTPPLRSALLEWLDAGIIAVFVVFLLVQPFLGELVAVTSAAMEPALRGSGTPQIDGPSDRLLCSRFLYRLRAPQRGEIVALRLAGSQVRREVRRVIGLPGDRVGIGGDGRVVRNGESLDEGYVRYAATRVLPEQQVPPGHLFVLGDNRRGDDTGAVGSLFIERWRVKGKAVAVCWPPERARLLR